MKTRLFAALGIVLVIFTLAYAQTGFAGKWSSNPEEVKAAESAATDARKKASLTPPTGTGGSTSATALAKLGGVQMDLAVAGNRVTGSIVLHDTVTLKITEGTFDGKVATMKSQHQGTNSVLEDTWTAEMKVSDTFVLKMETHAVGTQPNPSGSNIVPVTLHRVK